MPKKPVNDDDPIGLINAEVKIVSPPLYLKGSRA
jgi:hypothetical protein